MSRAVLDASALLVLIHAEPGHELVAARLAGAAMSAVNLSEVVAKLIDRKMPEPSVRSALSGLGLEIHPFDSEAAFFAGGLISRTRTLGLSFADRACVGLGMRLARPVVTADRRWRRLRVGVDVELVR